MSTLKNRLIAALLALGLGIAGVWLLRSPLGQQAFAGEAQLTGWVAYWDQADGLRASEAQASALSEIVIFAYHFDAACRVIPASPWVPDAARQFMASGRRTLVTIVNDVIAAAGPAILKDPQCIHHILTDGDERVRHLNELEALAEPVEGLEIDYENIWARDRDLFSIFIEQLAERLHARGKTLSVVVQPKTSENRRNGPGAFDWPELSKHADQIKIMAYHYHYAEGDPGPLAPPGWVMQIAHLAKAQIPSDKLCMVLTLHGFDWAHGEAGKPVEYAQAMRRAAPYGAEWKRDPSSSALWTAYEANGVKHEIWLEDGECVVKKMHLLRQAGVKWIGLWHLGAGDEIVEQAVRAAGGGRVSGGERTAQE